MTNYISVIFEYIFYFGTSQITYVGVKFCVLEPSPTLTNLAKLGKCYHSPAQVHSKPRCLAITEGNLTKFIRSISQLASPVIPVIIGSPTSFNLCLPVNRKPGMVVISRGSVEHGGTVDKS